MITENSDRNCYNDSNPSNPAGCPSLPQGAPAGPLVKTTWYDQLGRVRQTQDCAGNYVQHNNFTTTVSACSESATALYQLTSSPCNAE
jgi:hypothetical protein